MLNQLLTLPNSISIKSVGGFIFLSKRKKLRFIVGKGLSQGPNASVQYDLVHRGSQTFTFGVGFGWNFANIKMGSKSEPGYRDYTCNDNVSC